MPLNPWLAVKQVTVLFSILHDYFASAHATYVSCHQPHLHTNLFAHVLCCLVLFYGTALSFKGSAGQLDSSVSSTKETKWNQGRAVMSNSSYSVTYKTGHGAGKPSGDNGGFWEVEALWSPSLIEFPGTGLQCWGWLWSGSCGFREGVRTLLCADLSQTQVGWSGRGWRRRGAAGEVYCSALSIWRWCLITLDLRTSIHLPGIFSQLLSQWQITCSSNGDCSSAQSVFTLRYLMLLVKSARSPLQ